MSPYFYSIIRRVNERFLSVHRYKCDLCGVLLTSNQAVKIHKDGVHADKSGPRKYVCNHDGCSYQTNVLTNFTEHQRGHGPATYVCETCEYRTVLILDFDTSNVMLSRWTRLLP